MTTVKSYKAMTPGRGRQSSRRTASVTSDTHASESLKDSAVPVSFASYPSVCFWTSMCNCMCTGCSKKVAP